MKKLVITLALAVMAMTASAVEVGIRGTFSSANNMADSVGLTLGQKYGKFGIEGAFDRTTRGAVNVNRWSAVGSYDLATFNKVTVAPKLGYAYIDPASGQNGGAWTFGIGASYPVYKQVSLTADYYYQVGQTRVDSYNGNYFMVGAKYSF